MIDFGKLYCDLHPNQLVTNFCLKQTCMIGLCATCICTHTQFHINDKSTPQYQNIRNTFSSMHQLIRRKISSLDNQKIEQQKNIFIQDKISQFIRRKRHSIKQNVEQAKRQAINAINKYFENKEKSMLRQIQSQEKKMGLHSQTRMQSLMNSLSRQTSVLITSAQQLNSQNFLQSYQRIKTQVLANANKLQDDISKQLDRNQDFQTIINSNDQYLHKMVGLLQQSLQLSFKVNPRKIMISSQKRQSLKNSYINLHNQNIPSRIGQKNQPNYSTQFHATGPSSQFEQNNFSSISFRNVPEMNKQATGYFNQNQKLNQTTKSISLETQNNQTNFHCQRQNKSFIRDLYKSDIIKQYPTSSNISQSLIFKQKDINQACYHQSLNKTANGLLRNHQSQIITMQKPNSYQNNVSGNQSRVNYHHSNLNHSMIQTLQNQNNSQNNNNNLKSQLIFTSTRPSSLVKMNKITQNSLTKNQKFNFVPQMFDPSYFSKGNNQNHNDNLQCKKVRKSGLTLLKANQPNSTSRSKLHVQ